MKYNISDEIIFDRDTSQPREKLKYRRRLRRGEEQKNFQKSISNSKFDRNLLALLNKNLKDGDNNENNNKSKNDKNINGDKNDDNNKFNNKSNNRKNKLDKEKDNKNGEENGANKENEDENNKSKSKNGNDNENDVNKNKNSNNKEDENNQNNQNIKETQNAFIQVNFFDVILENERKKLTLKYKEKENEMRLRINNLIQNLHVVKIENKKEIYDLKNKLNEKNEEIMDLKNLNNSLKKQLEKCTNKVNDLNNQLLELKRQNRTFNITRSKNNEIGINDSSTSRSKNYESGNSENHPLYDYYSKNVSKKDINNQNHRHNNNELNNKSEDNLDEMMNLKNKQLNDSFMTMRILNKDKNKLQNDLNGITQYKKKDPSIITLNRSLNFKNKNKYINLLMNAYKTNKNFLYKNKRGLSNEKNQTKSEPNLSMNYLSKSLSNINEIDTLRKIQKDYSIRVYNNLLYNIDKNKDKRAISAKLINFKETNSDYNKSNFSKIFNDSERKALSTLFKTQEEFNNFNKKIDVIEKRNGGLVRQLLMENKMLTKENENKKEEILSMQEKLKDYENKLRNVNQKLNYEKYILNKTKKSFQGTKTNFENNKK